ncbi:methionine--tRNA ligase [Aureliella helgolandensis]|uniref:Methionine--tRNA ligase n=1 Tax=Aureliella helgolandensis TaxID=2527968 RepID=A0A518GF25_9BACT|nr:methionine--tRNA ligase [Aureliella helgolandensis]QDV27160.1 Methionine--tRNA ligase [Aureliella helgolandensis]
MVTKTRKILVTAALPYANGPIHIGHLVEYIQTDIWVRFQKLRGHRCVFVCADDTHGTAIMLRARAEQRSEEALIAETQAAHERDFAGFQVAFDNYGSTNSPENYELGKQIWSALRQSGLIVEREVDQLFDPVAGTFLADRFVRGTCPKCAAKDQYGDNCDKCGATYSPADLIDPVSTLSGATPEVRSALHLFVELEQLHSFLEEWTQSGEHLQREVANYLKGHFLCDPLRDWDISRPAPYFGFEIPDAPGNYWYVWFDAPIGYIASTWQWCKRHGEELSAWWQSPETEVHHFIGKDITYFHTLFWPGMLKTAGFSLPTKVHIHGFLNVGGEKMSKSKGTFIKAETYLKHLDPAYLRYYFASKLGPRLDDLDLNLEEFATKVNADMVGKVVNLASRTAKFAAKTGLAERYPEDGGLFAEAAAAGEAIAEAYEACDFARAMRLTMELADRANPYVENAQPWVLAKDPERQQELQNVCTVALNLFRQLAVYLAPVLPRLAEQCGQLLGDEITAWSQSQQPLTGISIGKFEHMLTRVKREDIEAMIDDSKEEATPAAPADVAGVPASDLWNDSGDALAAEPLAETCTIDDFVKIDLRVARILTAEQVPDARKLLKLTLGLGGDEQKTVFAGIKAAYEPESLVGRLVICVANLAPRQMKFGLSEGMVAAAGGGGAEVFLLSPDSGAKPGQRVH